MRSIKSKVIHDISGYYFIGLLALAIAGFWPTYFSKFFYGTVDANFYFHFHALMMALWIIALILQPILIRKKKLAMHRTIGKLTYFLMPLLFISVILLAHNRSKGHAEELGMGLVVPLKDLVIIGIMYGIAVYHRHNVKIHARAMVATGIVFIEPAMFRLIRNILLEIGMKEGIPAVPFLITLLLVYSLLIALVVKERKGKGGRWVFPLVIGLYVFAHGILLSQVKLGPFISFSKWFANLTLT